VSVLGAVEFDKPTGARGLPKTRLSARNAPGGGYGQRAVIPPWPTLRLRAM
jgi:hypothetical protein